MSFAMDLNAHSLCQTSCQTAAFGVVNDIYVAHMQTAESSHSAIIIAFNKLNGEIER